MQINEGYRQTDIGVFPVGWDIFPLSELTNLMTNGFVGVAKIHYTNSEDGVLYIQGYNVEENSFNFHGIKRVKQDFHQQHLKSRLQSDDLLTVQTGEVGLTTIVPKELEGANCHALIISRFKKELAFPKFFAYYFNSFIGRLRLKEIETGSIMKHINVGDLIKLKVPLPSLPEQQAIAEVLSDTDNLIQALEKQIAKKRLIKQGVMQELLRPKEGWQIMKLGEIAELITKGTTPTSMGREFQNNGINFIKIESLTSNGRIIAEKVAFIDEYTHKLLKRSQLRKGDILFSIAGALGRVAIVQSEILPANTNQALSIIRLNENCELDFEYLFLYLASKKIQQHINSVSVQGAQANLSLQIISQLVIEYPKSKSEQLCIVSFLSKMESEINTLYGKLIKYKSLKLGLMQNLLTGKIRLI